MGLLEMVLHLQCTSGPLYPLLLSLQQLVPLRMVQKHDHVIHMSWSGLISLFWLNILYNMGYFQFSVCMSLILTLNVLCSIIEFFFYINNSFCVSFYSCTSYVILHTSILLTKWCSRILMCTALRSENQYTYAPMCMKTTIIICQF